MADFSIFSPDGGTTALNVKDAKARDIVSDAFDSETSYDIGDYCIYEGALYKCTTAHTGAWNAADFTVTTIAEELKNSGGGGGATDAVKYTEQTLTDAQKTQARTNIGAAASDDNKLRLGQICGRSSPSTTMQYSFYQGFKNLLATSSTTSIVFSSIDMSGNVVRSGQNEIQQFGDFIGCRKAQTDVEIAPLAGRTAGKTKTGEWIHVESCYYMFYNCSGVTSLDLSMFDTSEVKDMTQMFYGCTALKTLDISSFDMTNVTNRSSMFGAYGTSSAPPLTKLKTPKINPYSNIYLYCTLYSRDGTAYTKLPVTTGTSIELRASWT